ncbi:MAG: amino acid permease [Gammaproteobacteria bacterium]
MKEGNKFGFWMLIALVIGNTIGAGIFMLPASLAKIGSISLLSWIFTSTGAMLFAFVFAKMSRMVVRSGGPYAYAKSGFGDFIGFQVAFTFWISLWTGNSSLIVTLIGYLRIFFPDFISPHIAMFLGISIIWIMAIINMCGIRPVGVLQIVTTIIKLIPILIVIGIGIYFFHPEYLTKSFNISGESNFNAFSYAATLTLWAFVGVESGCVPVGATHNPRRNIHLAMLIGTAVIAVIYIASSIAVMGMFPPEVLAHSSSPFAAAVGMVFGRWGQMFVVVCVVISCLGALNSGLLLESQVPMAAADDGLFPKIFSRRNKAGVPGWGLAIDATLMSLFVMLTMRPNLVEQFQLVITVAAVATLIAYLYSAMAEVVLISKGNDSAKFKKTNVLVAILAAVYALWAIFGSGKEIIFYTSMLLFSSILLYIYLINLEARKSRE